ncbi:MAG: TraR/DksA C4-type zinc finger protein [Anaerolineae bacterium]|nr:TraR/DksA C4-type zinc finger protein [Anaerolineae bacterium]
MITSTEELRPALLKMRDDLLGKVANLKESVALDGTGYTNHQADDATQAFDQAKDLALRTRSERTLQLVEDALRKLDAGTYGICENCGKPIDLARLEAIPYTPLCLHCAEMREFRRR